MEKQEIMRTKKKENTNEQIYVREEDEEDEEEAVNGRSSIEHFSEFREKFRFEFICCCS